MIIELRGTPGQLFSGYITSLENDGVTSNGLINDVASASGTFDDKGILIFDVQDLDNPSFTVVLSSQKPGNREDRMAVNNEGQLVHPGMFGTIFDAIGVPDSVSDESRLFGAQLGGVNLRFIGNEPTLVFRDSCTGDWYAVDRINDTPTHVFDANGLMLNIDEFNSVDVLHPTFGSSNPTRHLDMMTGGRFSLMSSQ